MNIKYPIASVAELLAEPSRTDILVVLLDGQAMPAGELVSAQSASGHLSKLVGGGLLQVQSQGRHRYYRIASPEVGHAIESLGTIFNHATAPEDSKQAGRRRLAKSPILLRPSGGASGSGIENGSPVSQNHRTERRQGLQSWPPRRALACGDGHRSGPPSGRAPCFARQCLDWTARKPHIAGALGAALYERLQALGWVARGSKTRAVRVTHQGARELHLRFGITA